MPFDLKTVPKVKLTEDSKNNVVISKKNNRYYYLFTEKNQQMMLDLYTNREVKEMYSSYDLGYGKILMGGLGFGILALWLSNKPKVESIHIIELSQDVVDIFLSKNQLPSNVTIEVADVDTYVTDKKYDCILLDHYELMTPEERIKSMKQVAKNIPNHDLFWVWSMEDIYTSVSYNLSSLEFKQTVGNNYKDFYEKWASFIDKTMGIPTIPPLNPDKLNEYIYTYVNMLDVLPSSSVNG
jgi:hypothetical protein